MAAVERGPPATATRGAMLRAMSAAGAGPLRVREILEAGIRAYRANASAMLRLAAVVVLPMQLAIFVVDIVVVKTPQRVPGDLLQIGTAANRHVSQGAAIPGGAISWFISALAIAVCTRAASEGYMGRTVDPGEALRFTFGRIGPILWQAALMAVALIVAFVALVVPGIYLYAAWSLALPVLLIEGLGARKSLSRSRALVKGRWWPVAGVLLGATLMALVVADGFALLVLAVIGRGSSVLSAAAITNAAIAVGMIVVTPFRAAVGTVLYYELQSRPIPVAEAMVAPRERLVAQPPEIVVETLEPPTRLASIANRALVLSGGIAIVASLVVVRVFGV